MRKIPVVSLLVALGACTSLKVGQVDSTWQSHRGIAYYLPYTQYETKVIWAASCDDHELLIKPKFEVTPKSGPDPQGLYVIDYGSLDAFTKTSGVKVEFYDSGAIKSINAQADDRSAEILSTVITAAGKVARVVAVAGVDAVGCNPELEANLARVADAEQRVDEHSTKLAQLTRDLERVTARVAREGAAVSDQTRSLHARAIDLVVAEQIELDSAKKLLAERTDLVSHTATTTFPTSSSATATDRGLEIPVETLRGWVSRVSPAETSEQLATRLKGIAESHAIWLKLAAKPGFILPSSTDGAVPERRTSSTAVPADAGIRYRIGVPGELTACQGGACGTADSTPVKTIAVTLLNRDTTFYLPFHSAAFTNASLTANFSEAGVLTSVGYDQKKAAGEAIAGVVGTAAGELAGFIEAERAGDKTELELLEEQVKLAKAKKELADAVAALEEPEDDQVQAQVAAFTADTALKQAEVANIDADLALIQARTTRAEAGGN